MLGSQRLELEVIFQLRIYRYGISSFNFVNIEFDFLKIFNFYKYSAKKKNNNQMAIVNSLSLFLVSTI